MSLWISGKLDIGRSWDKHLLRKLEMFRPKKESKNFVEMIPAFEELISPEDAIKAITEKGTEIESIRFQLPLQAGSGSFGAFRVEWKTPRYQRVSFEDV